MPPIRNPDVPCPTAGSEEPARGECFDDDPVIAVLVNPRLAEGFFVAYRDGELLSWGRMGVSTYPSDADTIHLNPADYRRLKTIPLAGSGSRRNRERQARCDKEAPDATDR